MQINKGWLKNNLNTLLLVLLTVSVASNQFILAKTQKVVGIKNNTALSSLTVRFQKIIKGGVGLSGNLGEDAVKLAFIQGIPEVYGAELNVNFDQPAESMGALKQFDLGYGRNKPDLSAEEKKRYTDINLKISCEFCCGAKAIVFENGEPSCGCAHSQAMRGLTAYLIKNHGTEYSDDQILRELASWKSRWYPKQMVQKMSDQLKSGSYTPDIASLLLDVKLPKYDGAAHSGAAPLPSDIQNAPSMVGGC
ncbi:MAG: hypothetical protein HYT15_04520 [Candidatus Magasanikbacteria bacterium]|nr:hypothetical protein [Candidatus Magasanikbacteria bacterium]